MVLNQLKIIIYGIHSLSLRGSSKQLWRCDGFGPSVTALQSAALVFPGKPCRLGVNVHR